DALGLDHCQVGGRVGPDDIGRDRPAVAEPDGDATAARGVLDDVVVGHDEAVGGEDHARPPDLLAGRLPGDRPHGRGDGGATLAREVPPVAWVLAGVATTMVAGWSSSPV